MGLGTSWASHRNSLLSHSNMYKEEAACGELLVQF